MEQKTEFTSPSSTAQWIKPELSTISVANDTLGQLTGGVDGLGSS